MKTLPILSLIIVGIFSSFISTAQVTAGNKKSVAGGDIFTSNSVLMNVGLGIPSFQTPYANSFALPKISVAVEFGVHKWVSIGGFFAFNYWASKGEDPYNRYEITQPDFLIGAKGSFHFSSIGKEKWNWNIDTEKLDFYASAFLGVGTYFWNRQITDKGNGTVQTSLSSNPYPLIGASAGIRYHFSPTVGIYGEVGYTPLGLINGGVSIKLK